MFNLKFVEHVRAYVTGLALRTPVVPSDWLSAAYGGQVWLKCENLQHTGSFKVRGPLARFPWLTKEERMMGVLCASAGIFVPFLFTSISVGGALSYTTADIDLGDASLTTAWLGVEGFASFGF